MVAEAGHGDHEFTEQQIERGRTVAIEGTLGASCTDCHESMGETFDADAEGGYGYPDINQYLSKAWLIDFIKDAGHDQFYGSRNRMPAFRGKLSDDELQLLVRWLVGDYPVGTPSQPVRQLPMG